MQRHPFLQELSRDHHHGLVLARRARRWAEQGPAVREHAWSEVQEAYESELLPHFAEEETRVLPLLVGRNDELVASTLSDHRRLRELVRGSTADELRELGQLLDAHIRFEERQLFPAIERLISAPGEPS